MHQEAVVDVGGASRALQAMEVHAPGSFRSGAPPAGPGSRQQGPAGRGRVQILSGCRATRSKGPEADLGRNPTVYTRERSRATGGGTRWWSLIASGAPGPAVSVGCPWQPASRAQPLFGFGGKGQMVAGPIRTTSRGDAARTRYVSFRLPACRGYGGHRRSSSPAFSPTIMCLGEGTPYGDNHGHHDKAPEA